MTNRSNLIHEQITLQAVLKRLPERNPSLVNAARAAFARHTLNAERRANRRFQGVDDAWADFQGYIEVGEHEVSRIQDDPFAIFEVVVPCHIPLPDSALSVIAEVSTGGSVLATYEDSQADNMRSIEDRLLSAAMRTWDGTGYRRSYTARREELTTVGHFDFVLKALTLERADLLMKAR